MRTLRGNEVDSAMVQFVERRAQWRVANAELVKEAMPPPSTERDRQIRVGWNDWLLGEGPLSRESGSC